jgi:hypothetical protein
MLLLYDDVTRILAILYYTNYLTTFANMRIVLILKLVTFCSSSAHAAAVAKAQEATIREEHMCLRWGNVTFLPDTATGWRVAHRGA